MDSIPFELREYVERLLQAREEIARWSARDFKRAKSPLGLTQTQFAILNGIGQVERPTISVLAERLELTVPTIVRAVDALERKCLVRRDRNPHDHREVILSATEEGAAIRDQVRIARRVHLAHLLGELTKEEREGLLRGYEALARAAHSLDSIEAAG